MRELLGDARACCSTYVRTLLLIAAALFVALKGRLQDLVWAFDPLPD